MKELNRAGTNKAIFVARVLVFVMLVMQSELFRRNGYEIKGASLMVESWMESGVPDTKLDIGTSNTAFSFTDPVWPKYGPPVIRPDCRVTFVDPTMQACHIV